MARRKMTREQEKAMFAKRSGKTYKQDYDVVYTPVGAGRRYVGLDELTGKPVSDSDTLEQTKKESIRRTGKTGQTTVIVKSVGVAQKKD